MNKITYKRAQQIRETLRQYPDGLTQVEIQALVPGWSDGTIKADLEGMPDAYIDRWVGSPTRHRYVAVWCVVIPPPNCPKPGYDV